MKEPGPANYVVALTLFALLLNHPALGPGYASSLRPASIPASYPPVSKQPQLCPPAEVYRAKALSALDNSLVSFVENRGQIDSRVAYYVQGRDTTIYFTSQGLTFSLLDKNETQLIAANIVGRGGAGKAINRTTESKPLKAARRTAVNLDFIGANPKAQPIAQNPTSD